MLRSLSRPVHAAVMTAWALAVVAGCGGGGSAADGSSNRNGATDGSQNPTGDITAVAWDRPSVRMERDVFSTTLPPTVTAALTMQASGVSYWFSYNYDDTLIRVGYNFRTLDEGINFTIDFLVDPPRDPGIYTDTLSVRVCHDQACAREVPGSPFTLPIQLDVGYRATAESGVTPLVPARTSVLNHDVLDAAYSAALDAVVTVSAQPEPALRVHDLQRGVARSIALLTPPTSLALGADGLQAVVGHDGAVSMVDLRQDAASPVRRYGLPMNVGAVVLAGERAVAVGGQPFAQNDIHWIDTSTGVSTQAVQATVSGIPDLIRHPAGDRIYMANRGVSPDDVLRMDVVGDPATATLHDTRYHGEYRFCGRLAPSPDGRRLYTGCGVVLDTDAVLANDMTYAGQMALSPPGGAGSYVAAALSAAPDGASVALLEEDSFSCEPRVDRLNDCHTRFATYDASTLARRSLFGLAPFERGSDRLQQWGRRVLHRADGRVIVIAQVRTLDEATPTWLMHHLDR